jgi:hypothetical protein
MRMTPNENAESAALANNTKGGKGSETVADIEQEGALQVGSPGRAESGGVRFTMTEEHPDLSRVRDRMRE